jgi:hypothetical protein
MKCPECRNNHKKSAGMKCSCGYQFLFNPATDRGLTDGRFLSYVRAASANDTNYFTATQLYGSWCRKGRRKERQGCFLISVVLFVAVPVALFLKKPMFAIALGAAAVMALTFLFRVILKPLLPRRAFDAALEKWIRNKGPIEKLITEPGLGTPPVEFAEPDIFDYGVERVLIVQRDILVDLFVRNGFHAEQRALVVSAGGYPDYLIPKLKEILSQSPELPVFLLHDVVRDRTPLEGSSLGVAGTHPVVDLGVFPDDVKQIPALRPFRSRLRRGEAVPVDLMSYVPLSLMLTQALTDAVPLGQVPAAGDAGSGDGGSSGFG